MATPQQKTTYSAAEVAALEETMQARNHGPAC